MQCNRGVGGRNQNVNVSKHLHSGIQCNYQHLTQFKKGSQQMISMDLFCNRCSTQNHMRTLNYNVTSSQ